MYMYINIYIYIYASLLALQLFNVSNNGTTVTCPHNRSGSDVNHYWDCVERRLTRDGRRPGRLHRTEEEMASCDSSVSGWE